MKMKKWIALLLSLVLILSFCSPMSISAEEIEKNNQEQEIKTENVENQQEENENSENEPLPVEQNEAESQGEGESEDDEEALAMEKKLRIDKEGNFYLNLEAYITGKVTTAETATPVDVVLLIDQSGSMRTQDMPSGSGTTKITRQLGMQQAVSTFLMNMANSKLGEKSRVSIVTFDQYGYTRKGWTALTKGNTTATSVSYTDKTTEVEFKAQTGTYKGQGRVIDTTGFDTKSNLYTLLDTVAKLFVNDEINSKEGGTNMKAGMDAAKTLVDEAKKYATDNKEERNTVVILFSDGVPTGYTDWWYFGQQPANESVAVANTMKAGGTTIYTVSILADSDVTRYKHKDATWTQGTGWTWSSKGLNSNYTAVEAEVETPLSDRLLNFVSSNHTQAPENDFKYTYTKTTERNVDYVTCTATVKTKEPKADATTYFMTATNAEGLAEVYKTISGQIEVANIKLDEETVLNDTLKNYIKITANENSGLYYQDCTGYDEKGNPIWSEETKLTSTGLSTTKDGSVSGTYTKGDYTENVTATYYQDTEHLDTTETGDAQKLMAIKVVGWNYGKHFVSETKKADGTYGQKLIVRIYITIDEDGVDLGDLYAAKVPTNGPGSGIYDDEEEVGEFTPPQIIVVDDPTDDPTTVPEVETNPIHVYVNHTLTLDDVKKMMVIDSKLDGEQNPYINVVYTLKQGDTEIATCTINAGKNQATDADWSLKKTDLVLNAKTDFTVTCKTTATIKNEEDKEYKSFTSDEVGASAYVYLPTVTWRDGSIMLGETAPDYLQALSEQVTQNNLVGVTWKDSTGTYTATKTNDGIVISKGTEATENTMQETAEPELFYTFNPTPDAFKKDTPVNVTKVTIGSASGTEITSYTMFDWETCADSTHEGTTPELVKIAAHAATAENYTEFYIHVKPCTLTIISKCKTPQIFKVTKKDDPTFSITIALDAAPENGSISQKIVQLPIGEYTVTTNTEWGWRYESDSESDTLSKTHPDGSVTFENKMETKKKWLSDVKAVLNKFTKQD